MQTSIEWLVEKLGIKEMYEDSDIPLDSILEQAKEMHKREIGNAFFEGKSNGMDISHPLSLTKEISFEEYYQETFKKD
jgi:hypothetical protein